MGEEWQEKYCQNPENSQEPVYKKQESYIAMLTGKTPIGFPNDTQ